MPEFPGTGFRALGGPCGQASSQPLSPANCRISLNFIAPNDPFHVCYLLTPNGLGTSKLAMKFDKGIGVVNTARNWNTVLKMRELAQGLGEE